MDPGTIGIILLLLGIGLAVGVFIGIGIGIALERSPRGGDQPANLVSFDTTVTHICSTTSCLGLLQWRIERWNDDVAVQLVSQKNGEATQSFIGNLPSAPAGILHFSGLDPRIFFDGPGSYFLTLTIVGNVSNRNTLNLEVELLEAGVPVTVNEVGQIGLGVDPAARRQISLTTTLGVGEAGFVDDFKNELRFCKGSRLTAIALAGTIYALSPLEIEDDLLQLGPDDDPNAFQPNEVDIIIRQNDNDFDQFNYRIDGTPRQLPVAVDLDEAVGLIGTRPSGTAPFFPLSSVGWTLYLYIECA
ncbi:MAG: hypothetical protein HOC72_27555 [Rhodospirillaceae bacterium]|nr:hypothetical protein [Rhodospirillaceae bacterium]